MTRHQWAGYNMIANNAFWQRLPAHVQDIVAPMQAWSIRFAGEA